VALFALSGLPNISHGRRNLRSRPPPSNLVDHARAATDALISREAYIFDLSRNFTPPAGLGPHAYPSDFVTAFLWRRSFI
jgi:hypothetical protein